MGVFSYVFSFLFFFLWALKRTRSWTNVGAFYKVRHTSTDFPKRCDRILISDKDMFKTHLLIVLGFNDTSTLVGHFVSSPREREKRDRRESRGDEREGQGRKRNRNESEETEEIKTFPLYPYPLQG